MAVLVEDHSLLVDPWTLLSESRRPIRDRAPRIAASMRAQRPHPELQLRSVLHARGLRYRCAFRVPLVGRGWTQPHLSFPRQQLAVYVDAHTPRPHRRIARDMRVTEQLRAAGWTVLRIWEHIPVEEAADMVVEALDRAAVPA